MDVDKKKSKKSGKKPSTRPGVGGNDTGAALRTAYQKMVEEQIPPEMLELLGKLD